MMENSPKQPRLELDASPVGSNSGGGTNNNPDVIPIERYSHVRKVLEREGPFTHPDFEASTETLKFISEKCKILIVGAGGLGCELVKNLSLMGFRDLHIIDMDTIDLSNLNRQFLFRLTDVGRFKAEVAAEFINKRIQGAQVKAHCCRIEEKDEQFYRQFHLVVCGLDSIVARRWLNGMIMSLVMYTEDGSPDPSSFIPIVDGGTEGFRGHFRLIIPTMSPCVECTLDLFPPQTNYPLCTLASKPRLPEHCIEYVRLMLWPQEKPFDASIDGDDPNHINWIYEKAVERASQFGITGVTYRLTQGVVKHIIPAVASTNAVIAAACATEVFKIATSCCNPMSNYMTFNDSDGIYTYTYESLRKEDCIVCSQTVKNLEFKADVTLQDLIDFLKESLEYQMKAPGVIAMINGLNKTLYMQGISITHANLKKKLIDLGVQNGEEINVADPTSPRSLAFKVKYIETVP